MVVRLARAPKSSSGKTKNVTLVSKRWTQSSSWSCRVFDPMYMFRWGDKSGSDDADPKGSRSNR